MKERQKEKERERDRVREIERERDMFRDFDIGLKLLTRNLVREKNSISEK